jgi:orotate phosphoribosyltransferase
MERVDRTELLELFRNLGVLLDGHFLLTSGKHTPQFLQCSQLMQHPQHTERLCRVLAAEFRDLGVEVVVGPAVGGIILAYEVARQLGVRGIFAEKQDDHMKLRRGFELSCGERALIVEDAVTTGGSVRSVLKAVREEGAEPVGVGMLIDRTAGEVDFGLQQYALLELAVPSYTPEECPLCREGVPLKRPKDA